MPKRPRSAIKRRNATRARRVVRRKRNPSVPRPIVSTTPFPKTRMVKLRYITSVSLDANAGATTSYAFRSNDLYDCDYSGTGAQPYYFDQLMQMYKQFTVVGSKIVITPFGATTAGHYYIVGLYRDTDTTARPATLVECMEAPGTKWMGVGDATQNPRRLSLTYSAKKTKRGKPLSNPDLAGTASSSPTDQDFYRIFAGCPTALTDPGQITINVVITYTAVLHDRIDPATSA